MKLRLILATLLLSACGAPEASDSSETAALGDAQRIDQRPDGKYDVLCRDGRREVVTAADLQQNNVCIPTGPTPGTVALQDRVYNLALSSVDSKIEDLGKGLWEGWLDFKVEASTDAIGIVDGTGATFFVSGQRNFTRMRMPVTFNDVVSGSTGTVRITQIRAEVTRVNDLPGQSLTGRLNMNAASPLTLVRTFAQDLTGVQITFRADARFFDNFDAGDRCGVLKIVGANRTELMTAAAAVRQFSLIGPVSIFSDVSCTSSRRALPQDPAKDFELSLSSITLGNPI